MKRLAILAVGLLFVGGLYACGDGETKPGEDVIIPNIDHGGPTTDQGGTDETPSPDIDEPDNDPGTPDQDPGTGGDTDTTPDVPPDNDPGTTDDGGGELGCVDDPIGSCKKAFECLNDCPQGAAGEACRTQCESNLSAEGMEDYQALRTCLQTYCSKETTDDGFSRCISNNCMEAYSGCFWGCEYGECSDLKGCLVDCSKISNRDAADECRGDCWTGATPEAQMDLNNAISCSQQACPICLQDNLTSEQEKQCDACWEKSVDTACASQWDKCVSYGEGNCRTLWTCVQSCGNDQECAQACGAAASKEAIGLYNKVWDCILKDDHCPSTMPDDEWGTCANAALGKGGVCDEDFTNCIGEQVYGDGNCRELWDCVNTCRTQECAYACGDAASQEAHNLYNDVVDCMFEKCPRTMDDAEWKTCANQALGQGGQCETQMNACYGAQTYGDATCGETVECLNGCGSNESCQRTCVNNATETGYGLLIAAFGCLDEACEDVPPAQMQTCYNEQQSQGGACFDAVQACANDTSPE